MKKKRRLKDEYWFPGFRPREEIRGIFGDSKARVIKLERSQKKLSVEYVEKFIGVITTRRCGRYGIYPVEILGYIWKSRYGEYFARSVGR